MMFNHETKGWTKVRIIERESERNYQVELPSGKRTTRNQQDIRQKEGMETNIQEEDEDEEILDWERPKEQQQQPPVENEHRENPIPNRRPVRNRRAPIKYGEWTT
jgi:hypothetical protein